jgi:hypothetical protein
MTVIEGIKIDIPGKELIDVIKNTATRCEQKAISLLASARRHQKKHHKTGAKSHEHAQMPQTGSDVMTGNVSPLFGTRRGLGVIEGQKGQAVDSDCSWTYSASHIAKMLQNFSKELTFVADHLSEKNTYRMEPAEYNKITQVPYEDWNLPED